MQVTDQQPHPTIGDGLRPLQTADDIVDDPTKILEAPGSS